MVFDRWGAPHTGRRYRFRTSYAPNVEREDGESSNLFTWGELDFRQYIPLSKKMNIAFRGYGYASSGDYPKPVYFGGMDTVRGWEFRSIAGDRGFYTNLEWRFPIWNAMSLGAFGIHGLRGFAFLDVGGAYFKDLQPDWECWDSDNDKLNDCLASYGVGISVNMFGMPFNWAFSRRWDFESTLTSWETSFWIGARF